MDHSLLRQVPTFLTVCDARGFGRAARVLGVSQPAVSYRIRQLEKALGAPVVERGRGRFILTPAGRRLETICREWTRAASAALAGEGPHTGEPYRIAAVSGFGRYVLFPALLRDRFLTTARLQLAYRTAEEVLSLVREGDADLGFVYVRRPSHRLAFQPVFREELVLIAPPAGPGWPARLPADAGRLSGYPFVTYEEHDYVFGKWFTDVTGATPRRLQSVCHFDELEETIDAVAAGAGLSVVPADSARGFGTRRVRLVRPAGRRSLNEVFSVRRPGDARPLADALCRALPPRAANGRRN